MRTRALTFDRERAAEYDVEPARGIIVGGIPGCGKSMIAKAVSVVWGVPLLYLDLSSTKNRFIGESERRTRQLLDTIDRIAGPGGEDGGDPIAVWVDEIEKSLAGGTGTELDSGTGARTMQLLLTWLQEHTSPVFVVAVGNRVDLLPPELSRAGRIDSTWFVGYPHAVERRAIIEIYKAKYRKAAAIDTEAIVQNSRGSTGSELHQAMKEAAIQAMADGSPRVTTAEVLAQLAQLPRTVDTFEITPGLAKWRDAARKANNQRLDDLSDAVEATGEHDGSDKKFTPMLN